MRLAARIAAALDAGSLLLTAGAGYGKTTVLQQALSGSSGPVARLNCSHDERSPEVLLVRILDAIAEAVPGASDALREGLAASAEQVDELAATRELLAEIPRLLVDRLTLVIDDAEHLEGAARALALVGELIKAELDTLGVAVASRRPLALQVAKPLASGRLTELGPADLVFTAEECAALLHMLEGREPEPGEVEGLIEATEGWPLGVALLGAVGDRSGEQERELQTTAQLRRFFTEEVLDSLDPGLRELVVDSSVHPGVTPEIAGALRLPGDFRARVERAGVLVHSTAEGFAYHPLLREFLLERLTQERGPSERARLHDAVAPAVARAGDASGAIEHWLEAESWPQAIDAIEREGPALVRTEPSLVSRWLERLPPEAAELPTILSLRGQLEWGAGDHPRAVRSLDAAVRGFRRRPNPSAEWLTRYVLADSLFSIGEFDELAGVVEGWDQPAAAEAGMLPAETVVFVAVGLATIGSFAESDRLAAAAFAHPDAARLAPVETLRLAFRDTLPGHFDRVLAGLVAAEEELARSDPFNRRLYFVSTLAFMYAERGYAEKALRVWMRVREGAQGGGGPFMVDTTYAWRAHLLAQLGRLADAESELAHYEGRELGWQTCIGHLARASVASLRGDAVEAVAEGEQALAVVSSGPPVFVHKMTAELIPVLASAGRPDRARELLATTLTLLDEAFPPPRGRVLRARLLALRAWLRHADDDLQGADADLARFWDEAGDTRPHTLRKEWPRLGPVVWSALERGALEPVPAIEVITRAFPQGAELVAFLEHPVAAVRAAALEPATASGDPAAFEQLRALADDPEPALARAASRASEQLAQTLPPLRFELLGGFDVRRGSWSARGAWKRPVDARLVRFLLVNLGAPVPEDVILSALWPELSASSARRSLQVAASRARRVLDPPGAGRSVLEHADRAYRLALGPSDVVDAERFRAASEAALAEHGEGRQRLLERARELWGGEPLPDERYSDWASAYRERLIDGYTAVLGALVEIHRDAGRDVEAAAAARDLVDLDPLDEGGHRALIVAYARAGRTGQALRQYLECRRVLVDELGIEPSEQTSRLQSRILAGEPV